jgi:thiol:disulfide interchange protein DsbD
MRQYISFLLLFISLGSFAQIVNPVKWKFEQKQISASEYELQFHATIEKGWHLYATDIAEGGPIATSFHFADTSNFQLIGKILPSKSPIKVFDKTFEMDLAYFGEEVTFTQKVKLKDGNNQTISGYVEYMSCNDETCTPPTEADFSFQLGGDKKKNEAANAINTVDDQTGAKSGLMIFFLFSFLAGLAAILTPCVFPMIPMTVSFFMHSSESKRKARLNALFYGLSIIAIYTIIGTFVAVIFGPDAANWISTHWIPNILFFVVFVFFAFSFFGYYEIVLPHWLVNRADKGADKGGIAGSFFMALTLVLVSFSCTGPIVGAILVESAGGQLLKPIIGMSGFALAFALPFTLFAIFPQWLSNLPKSGGWLNSVKVVLGFIELALGLKFLSVADQTYHWGILPREVYLVIWVIIFTLMGIYLLGLIRFKHDSKLKKLSLPRLLLAIISFAFVVYLIPGLFGSPLKMISGYLPPMVVKAEKSELVSGCEEPKYADRLHMPLGLHGYFDYEQGLVCARAQGKPLFIDFTGHGCVNCREMEANVWSDPRVLEKLKNDFVIVALYVDDKTALPEEDWVTSSFDGKVKKTIGKKYANFQIERFGVNAQPYYVILDANEQLLIKPKARDLNPDNFVKFLDEALAAYKKKQ